MWTVIDHLVTLLVGAWLGDRFARHREREKAKRESVAEDAKRQESARVADERLRHAIATAVTSARSRLEPLFHSAHPDRPATSEQLERIAEAASDFLRYVERIHELLDEALRRQVRMWYLNLDRAAEDLEHLSRPPEEFEWIENERVRKSKRAYALSRRQAAKRRLQSVLDDGARLELIGGL